MTPRTIAVAPLTAALAVALSSPAFAADAPTGEVLSAAMQKDPTQLDKVEVEGKYVRKAASPKYTEALNDTPQTITVVTKETMDQQGLLSLRDTLSTLPGITFGAGEGGGGYGDTINLRGFNASSDITVDGVRDSAQYNRTDNFNLQALELVNGANSAYSGAGSVGGNINLVSKQAHIGNATSFTAGAGTDSYGRVTADSNIDFGNGTALRLNAMAHQNDAPGRDYEEFERWGFAPSVAFGLGSDTRLTVSYLHQSDDNIPQYGVPYFSAFGGPLPGVDRSNYYGYHNVDTQEIDVDMLTGVFEHDFSENLTVRSLARFQKVDQLSIVNPPQGAWCLDSGINPADGSACSAPGTFQPSGPRGTTRDTSNAIAISQTDLTARFDTGAVSHAMVAGVSFSRETFELASSNSQRNPDGSTPTYPLMDLHNPDSTYTGPRNLTITGRTDGTLSNQSAYLFDTMKFGERWMLNLGARYDHNEGDNRTITIATPADGGAETVGPVLENNENLFSYRAGLVYKPVETGTVYLSYANSKTPSKASVNTACNETNCSVDPETAVNIELGTKWELLDQRLALTAAVFRNDRENFKVADPGNPDNPTGEQQLDGRARVDGVALGVAGQLTEEWSVFANYTFLDSEVLQSVSDFVKQSTGLDLQAGNPLPNTPEHSASLWTTYALPQNWLVGYGATYQDGYDGGRGVGFPDIKSYVTHRAMVAYQVNDNFSLQLNVNNLFDKEYYIRVRNNGWATPGDARSAVLTATYRF